MNAAKTKVQIMYFRAGGGHVAAANALRGILAQDCPKWDVTLVNLQDQFREVDPFYLLSGTTAEDYYNKAIQRGYTYGGKAFLRSIQGMITAFSPVLRRELKQHWHTTQPDLVVSVVPNFNRVMFRSLRAALPAVPYVTIMTDLVDIPGHFWQERQDQYLVCGTAEATQQARAIGYSDDRLFQTSGMILKPGFYQPVNVDRAAERQKLGLSPTKPTAILMSGGNGSQDFVDVLDGFAAAGMDVQAIVMCGRNEKLQRALSNRRDCHAVGFTDQVPYYMALADFFIGKPGPGSISEALQMGLPVVVEASARTMPQERFNVEWVQKNRVGLAVRGVKQVPAAVQQLLRTGLLEEFRANAAKLNNRALFEIPDILRAVLPARPRPAVAAEPETPQP